MEKDMKQKKKTLAEDKMITLALVTGAALFVVCTFTMLGATIWAIFAVGWSVVFAIPPVLILVIASLVLVRFVWTDWAELR